MTARRGKETEDRKEKERYKGRFKVESDKVNPLQIAITLLVDHQTQLFLLREKMIVYVHDSLTHIEIRFTRKIMSRVIVFVTL